MTPCGLPSTTRTESLNPSTGLRTRQGRRTQGASTSSPCSLKAHVRRSRNEIPFPMGAQWHAGRWVQTLPEPEPKQPITKIQALMEAGPGMEPEVSREETEEMTDAVHACVDRLGGLEQMLLQAVFYEGLSFRQLEERYKIPKSSAYRIVERAKENLRVILEADEIVGTRYSDDPSGHATVQG